MKEQNKIRNIAIIAHVDHGKTTLLDGLLHQQKVFRDNQDVPERVMDSYDQEKERGITIFAKHTSVYYNDHKINIIDTPGHADFSSEVERILGMVSSVLLIVDAHEGPMPQTRFVLSRALALGLRPLVILNKIDRPHAQPDRVLDETFDLFVELGATDEQLDFQHCYASAINGYAKKEIEDESTDFTPLLDMILEYCPHPEGDLDAPFMMQATSVYYDDYKGKQVSGRVLQGSVKVGDAIRRITPDGNVTSHTVTQIEGYLGLDKVPLDTAWTGDIINLSGVEEVDIGDTICSHKISEALPPIHIDAPTVSADVTINSGPLVGKSGKHVTMNKVKERLLREKKMNVSYSIEEKDEQTITVAGKGELHLAILFEAMRREGYEFCVSKPQVITHEEEGKLQEPIAKVYVEVPQDYAGTVIEQLSTRKGEMQHLHVDEQGISHIEFHSPVRGLVGYRNTFLTSTKGLGIMTSTFDHYGPWKGDIISRRQGVMISMSPGKVNGYACFNLEDRGELFTKPGEDVYEGMIVGLNSRSEDMIVNMTKAKQLTNIRASGSDESIMLTPPRSFTIEQAIGFISDDELVEVTPDSLRLRKRMLKEVDRKRAK